MLFICCFMISFSDIYVLAIDLFKNFVRKKKVTPIFNGGMQCVIYVHR